MREKYNIIDLKQQKILGSVVPGADGTLQFLWSGEDDKYNQLLRAAVEEVNRKGEFFARLSEDRVKIEDGSEDFFSALKQELFASLGLMIREETP